MMANSTHSEEHLLHEVAGLRRRIAELEQREATLRESEQHFRDFYENCPLACFTVGPDGRIRDCNTRAGLLTGYAVNDLVGRPVLDLYADTAGGRVAASEVFRRVLAGEMVEDELLEMRKADGAHVWISLTVNALWDAAGELVATRSLAVDVTDRQTAKSALLRSERRYQALFDLIPDGVVVIDADGIVVDCSRSACALYRCSRSRLIGRHVSEWMPPAATADFEALWGTVQQMAPADAEM
jgi:PAS domain S-box-containing protein